MHWQHTGQAIVTCASATWQLWFGAGLFLMSISVNFKIIFLFSIATGHDQQQSPRTSPMQKLHSFSALALHWIYKKMTFCETFLQSLTYLTFYALWYIIFLLDKYHFLLEQLYIDLANFVTMNRRKFLGIAGLTIVVAGGATYLLSDKTNLERRDIDDESNNKFSFQPGEKEILYMASLAPSGHNTQPWFVKYIEPYHWVIGNDKSKWLPAVDPTQRETMLSIGAFIQNLEFAAGNAGFSCHFNLLAGTNQDENILEVHLKKSIAALQYDISKIKNRRTVRSGYLNDALKKEDAAYLQQNENDSIYFIPNSSKEYNWLNEQTIEANRLQAYREVAQKELSEWIRFSSSDAKKHSDGLTTAGMELDGIPGWILRNFYTQKDVMSNKFREQGIDKVKKQVSRSAGWFIITSKDNSVETLLETGKRFQRFFLKIRDKNVAIHPMTQVLEESKTKKQVNTSIGISDELQFILRTGYLKNYPEPVTLRRPVNQFVKN